MIQIWHDGGVLVKGRLMKMVIMTLQITITKFHNNWKGNNNKDSHIDTMMITTSKCNKSDKPCDCGSNDNDINDIDDK